MMSAEIAIRACLGGVAIERASGRAAKTALIMENRGILAGAATILTECGVTRLARGTYPLRAKTYHVNRDPCPLFRWEADFVVEILSPTTGYRNLNDKRLLYERARMSEYWLVTLDMGSVFRYVLADGRYGPERGDRLIRLFWNAAPISRRNDRVHD